MLIPSLELYQYLENHVHLAKEVDVFFNNYDKYLNLEQVESQPITDLLFLEAQDFVKELKHLVVINDLESICTKHVKYPIEIQWRGDRNYQSEFLSEKDFLSKRPWQIKYEIKESILRTDIDTIFPLDKEMILGFLKIKITKGYNFKIVKIHTERKKLNE